MIPLATRMAAFGKLSEFNESQEWWEHYVEPMEYYFEANKIDEAEHQRAIFLSNVGTKCIQSYSTWCNRRSQGRRPSKSCLHAFSTLQPKTVSDCGTLSVPQSCAPTRSVGEHIRSRASLSRRTPFVWGHPTGYAL